MRGVELLEWLAAIPARDRDARIEAHLGIAGEVSRAQPGEHLLPYHAAGVAPIVHALVETPVTADDVLVDVGSGLGKVVLLAHLLTGAKARGVEVQAPLVLRAREAASRLHADVRFDHADARDAAFDDATVLFFYTPFEGPVLAQVLERLAEVARRRAIVVCALGVDLHRAAPWLVARPLDAFWLTIYDSVVPGAAPRARALAPSPLAPFAERVAHDR